MTPHEHPPGLVLQTFFDNELEATEAAAIAEHCASCVSCGKVLAELQRVQDQLQACAPQTNPAPVWSHVADRVGGGTSRRFGPAWTFGTVAACAAGIALGVLLGAPAGNNSVEQSATPWSSTASMLSGEDESSLIDVYSAVYAKERSNGS